MKTLILMRHALPEDFAPTRKDFDRRLTPQGQKDATEVGDYLLKAAIKPEIILYSNAVRTTQTAKLIAEVLCISEKNIQEQPVLYNCSIKDYNRILQTQIPDNLNTVMIIGHNPTISQFAYQLQNQHQYEIDNLTPGACIIFTFNTTAWCECNNNTITYFNTTKPNQY